MKKTPKGEVVDELLTIAEVESLTIAKKLLKMKDFDDATDEDKMKIVRLKIELEAYSVLINLLKKL